MKKFETQAEKDHFLNEVRRRRNLVWLWLPVAIGICILCFLIFQLTVGNPPSWFMTMLNILVIVGYFFFVGRISNIRCPRCGYKALRSNPAVSMKNVRCRWCDYPYKNAEDYQSHSNMR